MGAMRLKLDAKEPIEHILHDLDPLMIAIGLALASLAPGPAGEAGAVAAIVFDVKCRRWGGVILSAASMIPVVGYVPAIVKVALLVFLLNRRLRRVEAALPELQESPDAVRTLQALFGKYHRSIPNWKITRKLRVRLERIMASGQRGFDAATEPATVRTDNSTMIP